MTPRPIGEIISEITSKTENEKICELFLTNIDEIFSHSKDDITNQLIYIKDKDIFDLRESLGAELIKKVDISSYVGIINNNESENSSNTNILRKRYKACKCYEDIYILGISIHEKGPHKDLSKILNINQNLTQTHGTDNKFPSLNETEKPLISAIMEMKDLIVAMRKENKDLTENFEIMNTKIDNQSKEIRELKVHLSNKNNSTAKINILNKTEQAVGGTTRDHCNDSSQRDNTEYSKSRNKNIETPSRNYAMAVATQNLKGGNLNATNSKQEGFTDVTYKKKKKPIFGIKEKTSKSIAGERIIQEINIFIGGVSNDISEEDLALYIEEEIKVSPRKVILNKENTYNRSFKLIIRKEDKDTIFRADAWEKNIIIKPFREKRYWTESLRYQKYPTENNQNKFYGTSHDYRNFNERENMYASNTPWL